MRNILLPSCCVVATLATAQSSYVFEHEWQQYTTLLTGQPCTMSNGEYVVTELDGETFQLHGEPFTLGGDHTLVIGADGYVRFQDGASRFDVDVLATELEIADPGSMVVYTVTGGPGAHLLKVEWRDWGIVNGPPNNILSFQLMIDQATGIIELRYGATALLGPTVMFTDETGPHAGLIHRSNDMTVCYEKTWLRGPASDPEVDTSTDLELGALHNVPASHRVYRFTPDAIASVPSLSDGSLAGMNISSTFGGEALTVRLDAVNGGDLRCYDMQGRETGRWPVTGSTMVLVLHGHGQGCYVLRYNGRDGRRASGRFVR